MVIVLSFAFLMNRESERSSDDELSQSAYDSAMAGVEDAKRVIVLAQAGNLAARDAISAGQCNTVARSGIAGDTDDVETIIQSSSAGTGSELQQAYTCVTISMNSENYESSTEKMKSAIIPLRGERPIASVKIDWHQTEDSITAPLANACNEASLTAAPLCREGSWGASSTVPALLRAQFITPGNSFSLSNLDTDARGGTVFLYPKQIGGLSTLDMTSVGRHVNYTTSPSAMNDPERITCTPTVTVSGYHCSATINLRDSGSSSQLIPANSPNALLRLTPYYNSADFRITLLDASNRPIDFVGVQPVVDSTGRANDLFRRVEARLSLTSDQVYPEFALDVAGNLCKDFYVSHTTAAQLPSTLQCAP